MGKKRILIVDDDADILFLLAHSLKRTASDYIVDTAIDGRSAMDALAAATYDLVLTDHMMPELTGLQLAETIRRNTPETRIVLMTAYESHRFDNVLGNENLDGFINKPFKIPNIIETVQQLLHSSESKLKTRTAETVPVQISPDIPRQLRRLWEDAGADLVLLLSSEGQPLHSVGETDKTVIARLASFVADNFFAVTELASLLGDNQSSFKSSYYEGDSYNIYAHGVNKEAMLAVIFGVGRKPGPIWIYTRQTAANVAVILDDLHLDQVD